MRQTLLVVAKHPTPGHTKTRLCPPLSSAQAAALYGCFLRDTLDVMRRVPDVERAVAYLAEDDMQYAEAHRYFSDIAPDMPLTPQRGNGLGERLHHLLSDALADGSSAAVVMDSDSPTLPHTYLEQAFALLRGACDVVLGPCDDGGYYLIGLKKPQPRLLREVRMSTPTVLADTLDIASHLGLQTCLLPVWYDVDTAAELARLQAELALNQDHIAPLTRAYLAAMNPMGRADHAGVADHPGVK